MLISLSVMFFVPSWIILKSLVLVGEISLTNVNYFGGLVWWFNRTVNLVGIFGLCFVFWLVGVRLGNLAGLVVCLFLLFCDCLGFFRLFVLLELQNMLKSDDLRVGYYLVVGFWVVRCLLLMMDLYGHQT